MNCMLKAISCLAPLFSLDDRDFSAYYLRQIPSPVLNGRQMEFVPIHQAILLSSLIPCSMKKSAGSAKDEAQDQE
jgi:hypothetical protein